MLKYLSTDLDYRNHLHFDYYSLDKSQKTRLSQSCFKTGLHKLKKLSIDRIADILFGLYSDTGRPANDPAIYIRSCILMQHLNYTSIDVWCNLVAHDSLLLYLIGTTDFPNSSSHYDFIKRLTHDHPHLNDLLPEGLNSSKHKKLKKGEKWENYTHEDTSSLVDKYTANPSCDRERYSYTLQCLYDAIAVAPSYELGLIESTNLIANGDGSASHIHASPFGHRVLKESEDGLTHRYSAPEADIGWDSDLATYYYGYTLYNISCHNSKLNIDLPLFLSIEKASRHDALTTISATAQFFDINTYLHPRYMCFDSASDNYPTHEYLHSLHITPIIDINPRKNKNLYSSFENLNEEGTPVCMNNIPMIYNGYEAKKHRSKYRCPLAMGKISSCPHKQECCPNSSYGKIRYIKDSDDIKLFGPVPYKSEKWKEIYKNRTCTERMNNRILNDYNLQNMKVRNQAKYTFFAIFAGINIHLDAQVKVFE